MTRQRLSINEMDMSGRIQAFEIGLDPTCETQVETSGSDLAMSVSTGPILATFRFWKLPYAGVEAVRIGDVIVTSQTVSQSVTQSVSKSVSQTIRQSASQSVSESVRQ